MNPDVALALASAPQATRPAIESLWALDEALGKVLVVAREPMISRIRLAWWREALERLDREPPPKEPVLEGLAREVLPRGITGVELAAMESAWALLPGDEPITAEELNRYGQARGALLFRLTARLLGSDDETGAAGEAWALVDLARHSTEVSDIEAALEEARRRPLPRRWPKALRPLGMLAVLVERDIKSGPLRWEQPGSPPRTARMLRHRLTGW